MSELTKKERDRLIRALALDDDEIEGHAIFDVVAEMIGRDEKHDAINRLVRATAPLQWTATGVLPQAVYLAESYITELEGQRDLLLQAMWDARTALGFDPDGDKTFHMDRTSRVQLERVAKQHVAEAEEFRRDSDEQWISQTEVNRLAQLFYESSEPRLPIAMTDKPQIVEGLVAVLTRVGYEVRP